MVAVMVAVIGIEVVVVVVAVVLKLGGRSRSLSCREGGRTWFRG
jgi:hypothetical protein